MNPTTVVLPILLLTLPCLAQNQVVSARRAVDGEPKQEYFLIHRPDQETPRKGHQLLLVLPGGDGSAGFNPFVTNIARNAVGPDCIVAQLIAVKWSPEQRVIWPTKESKVTGMKFTTEEFIAAVIADVSKQHKLDPRHIDTLSWSSGGPAAYAASLAVDEITGSFVAMSVFKPDQLEPLDRAKGQRYYIYHSQDDKVCPFRMAENAKSVLSEKKASVKLETYNGGHGWHGNIFAAIRSGLEWLRQR